MIDQESALPLYIQVKEVLTRQIRNGTYQPHESLPPERVLLEKFGVSRITIRRALSDLVNEGLLYRKVGKGTFVAAEPIVEALTELYGHLEELQRRNLQPEVTLLSHATHASPPEAAAAPLGFPESVMFTRRLVKVEGAPLLILELCIPDHLGMRIDPYQLTHVPIHRLLEAHGLQPFSGEQRILSRSPQAGEAEMLRMEPGSPVLEVVRTEWTAAGLGLLWSRAIYRGDRYQYVVRLHRRRSHA